jgi:hypothetical protein
VPLVYWMAEDIYVLASEDTLFFRPSYIGGAGWLPSWVLTLFHTGEKIKYLTRGKLKTPSFSSVYFNRVKSNLPYKLLARLVLVKSILPYIV